MFVHLRVLALVAVAGLTAAPPARAATALEPGLWQDTETAVANGKLAAPQVRQTCLSAEEARDPIKTILRDTEGQKCETPNVKENDGTLAVEMKCVDPRQMRMEINLIMNVLNPRHYTGTIKSVVDVHGQKIASERAVDSKWIAASCKK